MNHHCLKELCPGSSTIAFWFESDFEALCAASTDINRQRLKKSNRNRLEEGGLDFEEPCPG